MNDHLITDHPVFRTVATTTSNGVRIAEYELHGEVWCNVGRVVLSAEELFKIADILRG